MKKWIPGIFLLIFALAFQAAGASDGRCGTNVKFTVSGKTISFSKADPGAAAVWRSDCGAAFKDHAEISVVKINDPIRVTDAGLLFSGFPYVREMYLSNFDTSGAADMDSMFAGCRSLTTLDAGGWNTSGVLSMGGMFLDCSSLTNLNMSGWDTSAVTDMDSMFARCTALKDIDVSGWNTSAVTDMAWMFYNCQSLRGPDVSRWDTSAVTNVEGMFYNCRSLRGLDVSRWDTSAVEVYGSAFGNCISLESIRLGEKSVYTNIFSSLPEYLSPWYYAGPSPDAANPIAAGSVRQDGALFTGYTPGRMAGIWSVDRNYPVSGQKLTLPGGMKEIRASAFEGSSSIGEVILPQGLTAIGSRAFSSCARLRLVRIPDSVTSIADDAFRNTVNLIFFCASDNAGAAYARAHDIPYRIESPQPNTAPEPQVFSFYPVSYR